MRRPVDAERVRAFMRALGRESDRESRVYFTGGATAVLYGWRTSTIDLDIKLVPEDDKLLRAIPRLKESQEINVELASPDAFIPELPGWASRSRLIAREGKTSFYHYDFYAQALSKIERGHEQDLEDVKAMFDRGLVDRRLLRERFTEIEPVLYRYPAIDPASFRGAVERAVSG